MTDFKKEIDDIKKSIASKEIERAKLEQKIEDLEKQQKDLIGQLQELNCDSVEDLIATIDFLEQEIAEGVKKCQTILS